MKVLAIICMLLTLLAIAGFGLFFLIGFAMSFDAPGSDKDPSAWGMRLLMFLPAIIFILLLFFAWKAYAVEHYKQAVFLGAVTPLLCLAGIVAMTISSMSSLKAYRQQVALGKEEAAKYPIEKYMRHGPESTDTILVFPNGIVSYRLYQGPNLPFYGGPLGELDEKREFITYNRRSDNKLPMEQLYHFMDEEGAVFTNKYRIQ